MKSMTTLQIPVVPAKMFLFMLESFSMNVVKHVHVVYDTNI
jgi:hypothetical protein